MCYLARTEGSDKSFIEWSFNFDKRKVLEKVEIKCITQTYENGNIVLSAKENDKELLVFNRQQTTNSPDSKLNCSFFSENESYEIKLKDNINQLDNFTLRAELSQGKGSCSWQHTQLFRAHLKNDENTFLFRVCFYFK